MTKRLHEQLAEMNLHGMSKCELLMELSGTGCYTSQTGRTDVTPCKEHREIQKEAIIQRILEEYEPKRTCRIVASKDEFGASCCKCTNCGDLTDYEELRLMKPGSYCMNCGAKAEAVEDFIEKYVGGGN